MEAIECDLGENGLCFGQVGSAVSFLNRSVKITDKCVDWCIFLMYFLKIILNISYQNS